MNGQGQGTPAYRGPFGDQYGEPDSPQDHADLMDAESQPGFCEAAAEWDHAWWEVQVLPDGTSLLECQECGVRSE